MPLHQAQVSRLCAASWGLLWLLSVTPLRKACMSTAMTSMHQRALCRYM